MRDDKDLLPLLSIEDYEAPGLEDHQREILDQLHGEVGTVQKTTAWERDKK